MSLTEDNRIQDLAMKYFGQDDYYIECYKLYKSGKKKINLMPLLFGGYWLIFKGMIVYGLIYFSISSLILKVVPFEYARFILIIINGSLVIWGNQLYFTSVERKARKIVTNFESNTDQLQALYSENKISFIRGIIISILVGFITSYLR